MKMLEVSKPNTNIKYVVDKENGTIICEFKDLGFELVHMIISVMNYNSLGSSPYDSLIYGVWESSAKKVLSNFVGKDIRGVAKCHPDDNFDMEYGMELSRARMLNKFYAIFSNAFKEVSCSLYTIASAAKDTEKFYGKRVDKFLGEISSLTSEYEIVEE